MISIDWVNKIINVPQADMLLVQSTPVEVRQLDLYDFHMALRALEADVAGINWDYTHNYQPPLTISGVPLARVVDITNDYTVTFEQGLYNVNVTNGNSNIADRVNKNSVGVNTSNSAGLQDLSSLQAASFADGAVSINQTTGALGTTYPIGTKGKPAKTWADAKVIAETRNMDTIVILGMATLTDGDDVSDMTVKGTNPMISVLTVYPGSITTNLYVRDLYFTGTLDGGSILRDCVVGDTYYFNGYMEHCALVSGTTYVHGIATLMNCASGATCISAPVIDMTNATGIAIRNFDGNLKIVNKVGTGACQISINGFLEIDSQTCTTGELHVYGDGYVVDELGNPWVNGAGKTFVHDYTTGSPEQISDAVWTRTTRELTSAVANGATAQEVWEYGTRTLTTSTGLDENQLHTALDNYTNKDDWKANVTQITDSVWSKVV